MFEPYYICSKLHFCSAARTDGFLTCGQIICRSLFASLNCQCTTYSEIIARSWKSFLARTTEPTNYFGTICKSCLGGCVPVHRSFGLPFLLGQTDWGQSSCFPHQGKYILLLGIRKILPELFICAGS